MAKKFRRYHFNVYFPEWKLLGPAMVEFYAALPKIGTTHHAAEQIKADKRGLIPLPNKKIILNPKTRLIEFYEILNQKKPINGVGTIQKIVVRVTTLSDKYDYAYVIAREGYCVSAWALDKNDEHRLTHSLDNYYCPESMKDEIYKRIQKEQESYKNNVNETNNRELILSE